MACSAKSRWPRKIRAGALRRLRQGTQLDAGYFKPIVQAGMVQYDLGNKAAAEPLLTRSMQLLPTAPGAYYLGRLNEDRGNTAEAVKLYKMAAGRSRNTVRKR